MAEETTSTTSDQQLSQIINQLLAGKTAQPAVDPNTGPSSREGRGILSLLGEGLGGGAQYGSTQEREQGGLSALGALGSRMLQASDWSATPHTFGSILGQGLDAARGNLGQTQAVSAAQHYAAQQLAHQQQEDQIARLKEALPYLSLQQQQRAADIARRVMSGGTPGSSNTSIGNAGDGSFLGTLASVESGDKNIVSTTDKDSKGLTLAQGGNPAEISQGHFQIQTATWKDFAPQAGVDVSKYPNAMSAPREVQAQVAAVIPFSRFGPRTQAMMREKFGDLDGKQTVGSLAAARAPAPPGQVASAPPTQPGTPVPPTPVGQSPNTPAPPSVQVAGPGAGTTPDLPTPPIPPAVIPPAAPPESTPSAPPATTVAPTNAAFNPADVQVRYGPLPPELAARPTITPEENASIQRQIQIASPQLDAPTKLAEVESQRRALLSAKIEKQNADIQAWRAKEADIQRTEAGKQAAELRANTQEADKATRAQANALELERIKAGYTIDQQGAAVALEGDKDRMKKGSEAAAAVLPVSEQLRQLPALMSKLPPGGLLSSLMGQYPQLASVLEAARIVDPGTADNVAIFTGLTNHLSSQLRATGSGPTSDKDLDSFKTTLPRLLESPEGRTKAVAFLQNIADRVLEAQDFTNEYFRRIDPKTGKPAHNLYHLKDALNAPRRLDENGVNIGGLGPVIPAAPKFQGPGSGAAAAEWLRVHTQSGRPYTAWLPDENGVLRQQLMVRE